MVSTQAQPEPAIATGNRNKMVLGAAAVLGVVGLFFLFKR